MQFCNLSIFLEQQGFCHTVVVAKMNEIQMKGKHEELLTNFFNGIHREEMEGEFQAKVTGFCCVYAPYYICMFESEDTEFVDYMLRYIQSTIGTQYHEQVWCMLHTQDVPEKAFDQFHVRSFPAQQSQAEIKQLPMVEKVSKIYTAMLGIGSELHRVINDPTKTKANLDSVLQTQSITNLPAQEDLVSALGADMMTLGEHLSFYEPNDILLEDELCWPVKPDLKY